MPANRKVTYGNFVYDHSPLNAEILCMRLAVGGDRLDYPYDSSSPVTNLIDTKIMLNSIIYDAHRGEKLMVADLKDFFLNTPMKRAESMKIKYKYPRRDTNTYNPDNVVNSNK